MTSAPRAVETEDFDADGQPDAIVGLSFDRPAAWALASSTLRLQEIPVVLARDQDRTPFADVAAHDGAYLFVSLNGSSLVRAVYDAGTRSLAPDVVTSLAREVGEPVSDDVEVSFAGSPPLLVVSRRSSTDVAVYRVREHPAPGAFVGPLVARLSARATRALAAAAAREMGQDPGQ